MATILAVDSRLRAFRISGFSGRSYCIAAFIWRPCAYPRRAGQCAAAGRVDLYARGEAIVASENDFVRGHAAGEGLGGLAAISVDAVFIGLSPGDDRIEGSAPPHCLVALNRRTAVTRRMQRRSSLGRCPGPPRACRLRARQLRRAGQRRRSEYEIAVAGARPRHPPLRKIMTQHSAQHAVQRLAGARSRQRRRSARGWAVAVSGHGVGSLFRQRVTDGEPWRIRPCIISALRTGPCVGGWRRARRKVKGSVAAAREARLVKTGS